jgi:hypothetical protein
MQGTDSSPNCTELKGFTQTRYFYGQRLDVRHFELEQNYVRGKLWMLNRLVHGFGVACGLDVTLGDDHKSVVVQPGLALDKAGREIVVPCPSAKQAIPAVEAEPAPAPAPAATDQQKDCCDDANYVTVFVCFQACETDPEPVLAGGCDATERCAPGVIRERYKLMVRPGKARAIPVDCTIPDLLLGNRINYPAIARWVSEPCPCLPDDTCIPLANVHRLGATGTIETTDIDITIRPVVYSNDLLYEMILALLGGDPQNRRSGKY